MSLSGKKYLRYERHIDLPKIGEAGQLKLLDARVLIVGAGGLGTPAAAYLAAAGVGTLVIIDDDVVQKSNLQRQIFYTDGDAGKAKVDCLRTRLMALNSEITVEAIQARLTRENGAAIISACDVVIDGSDNFATKYLLNELCIEAKKPLVYGAVYQFEGQIAVFQGYEADKPCYRCLYRDVPEVGAPTCTEAAVWGPGVGMIGTLQASEAMKLLLDLSTLAGGMLLFNALTMQFENIQLAKDKTCPACGK